MHVMTLVTIRGLHIQVIAAVLSYFEVFNRIPPTYKINSTQRGHSKSCNESGKINEEKKNSWGGFFSLWLKTDISSGACREFSILKVNNEAAEIDAENNST